MVTSNAAVILGIFSIGRFGMKGKGDRPWPYSLAGEDTVSWGRAKASKSKNAWKPSAVVRENPASFSKVPLLQTTAGDFPTS